uniref:Putative pyridoxal phosphate-dependent aminotransferase n=1 Tax=Streptomyces clavuligerus TaxID=1901 RepID=Q9X5H0_STRCL|nr:putative pyridoxal phosphate-dependent aminotransferase [Streptomyces clavuligerus]
MPGSGLEALDRATLIHPTLSGNTAERIVLTSGSGSRVRDTDGREYLDASAVLGVTQVGHGRAELARVAAEQMARLEYFHTWGTISNDRAVELAARLVGLSPEPLTRVYFTSGGAEGNEIALRMARLYHHRRGESARTWILSRRSAYHGVGYGSGGVTGFPAYHQGFGPSLPDVDFLTPPQPYRRELFAGSDVTDFCLAELRETIDRIGPERIAAMIGEPIMGAVGAAAPPADYWPRVAELLHSYGILLISDEVITGYGRTGHWFAADHFGVVPDIMVTAKGITSGYVPHGAVLTTEAVADEVVGDQGFPAGFTYSGHATACAVALANLDIIERENLLDNASTVGAYLGKRLAELSDLPIVGDVRQTGLMLGVELVADRGTREPLPGAAVAEALRERAGILLRANGNALIVNPPLIFTQEDADELVAGLRSVLARTRPDGRVL